MDYPGRMESFPNEDEKRELIDLHMGCGGPAATALVTLSRLGICTSFLGAVSDDLFGQEIVKNFERENIDISGLKITPGFSSQFAFIAITRDTGKRTVFWHRGSVPKLLTKDIDINRFTNARILHLDGLMIDASIEAARQAKAMGMTVVMDGGTLREGVRDLALHVDILIASETFASALIGSGQPIEDALFALQDLGPAQVAVTLGKQGSVGLDDHGVFRQEAFTVQALDTTGAGDVYHGAYIYGILQGWRMPKCMRFASAAAALKCKGLGAQNENITLEGIMEILGYDSRSSASLSFDANSPKA